MATRVLLTHDAARDLEEIHEYIAQHGSTRQAQRLLERLETALERLAKFPGKRHYPRELLALGVREYRESRFKPHRIIYATVGHHVVVYLIADGRRDMQSLLSRRLLG